MENGKINLKKFNDGLTKELKNIKNPNDKKEIETIIRIYLENEVNDIKDDIDIEPIIENALKIFKEASNVKQLTENEGFNKILDDTINLCYVHKFESELAIKSFKELAKYDKVFHTDQGKYFYKIYQMLSMMVEHRELIEKLENLEDESVHNRGIAKTKYENIQEAITPNLNHYKKALEFNDIDENKLAKNIAQAFKNDPRETNAMLELCDINLMKDITDSEKRTFENQNTFFNSAEKIEDTDIFKSCQIYSINLFKKKQALEIIKAPSNEKLANYVNHILNDFFDMYKSKLNRNHINKPTQWKANFKGVDILEYETSKNKKEHPYFK